jgi:hypothetical protein
MSGGLQPRLVPRPLTAISMPDAPEVIGTRPNLCAKPYRIEWQGKTGTAATDGHVIVALWGDESGAPLDPSNVAMMTSVLAERDVARRGVAPWSALVEWCGRAVRQEELEATAVECKECDGTGEVECECRRCGDEHDAECDECDGTGKVTTTEKIDPRPGHLGGVCVARNLLAMALECVPAVDDLEIASSPSAVMVWIDAGLWRLVIMGLKGGVSTDEFAGLAEMTD